MIRAASVCGTADGTALICNARHKTCNSRNSMGSNETASGTGPIWSLPKSRSVKPGRSDAGCCCFAGRKLTVHGCRVVMSRRGSAAAPPPPPEPHIPWLAPSWLSSADGRLVPSSRGGHVAGAGSGTANATATQNGNSLGHSARAARILAGETERRQIGLAKMQHAVGANVGGLLRAWWSHVVPRPGRHSNRAEASYAEDRSIGRSSASIV